jgi:hypothetical protein
MGGSSVRREMYGAPTAFVRPKVTDYGCTCLWVAHTELLRGVLADEEAAEAELRVLQPPHPVVVHKLDLIPSPITE